MARVLVVDDSSVARLISRRALESAGHSVDEAETVSQAWALLTSEPTSPCPIDLVLLDWNMPGGNGLELAQLVQDSDRLSSVAVVFVTSDADVLHQSYAAASGAQGYVLKPFSADVLLSAVSKALAS